MTFDLEGWRACVREAAIAEDGAALGTLYAEGKAALGSEAGTEWARVLSSLDGSAHTG